MKTIVDEVCVDGAWMAEGGNTPWGIPGRIMEITIQRNDPRNYDGCDSDFIEVIFDSKRKLTIKASEYMYVERGDY